MGAVLGITAVAWALVVLVARLLVEPLTQAEMLAFMVVEVEMAVVHQMVEVVELALLEL
jgi:hypothetical protein